MEITQIVALITVLISCGSLLYTIKNSKRADTSEIAERVKETTAMNMKLDAIKADVTEIKEEFKTQGAKIERLAERMAKAEASIKRAHERLDDHFGERK